MRFFFFLFLLVLSSFLIAQTQIGMDINGEADSFSGTAVSLSDDGTIVAIGAPFKRVNFQQRGQVRVLEFDALSNSWSPLGNDIEGTVSQENLGSSVSLSADGMRVAIGAGIFPNSRGYAAVYEYNTVTDNWDQVGNDIEEETLGDMEGAEVSLSADGTRIIIGSPQNDDNGTNAGHARIFEEVNGAWVQLGQTLNGVAAEDHFGTSVAISADGLRVIVGGDTNDNAFFNAGHAIIYEYSAGSWNQVGNEITGRTNSDFFGLEVAISPDGERVAISGDGGPTFSARTGFVNIYEETENGWNKVGSTIFGDSDRDRFGVALALSNDGKSVVIGASGNDNNANGAGQFRLYRERSGDWVKIGDDLEGDAEFDALGGDVAISSDGAIIAVGAPRNNDGGNNAGQTSVFDFSVFLPVDLLSFTATPTAKATQLNWSTAGETENGGFSVEHATDATNWRTVGYVAGVGTSEAAASYGFQHDGPAAGTNYYRLKQMDFDGTFAYSNVVTVQFSGAAERLLVYPNPAPAAAPVSIVLPEGFAGAPVRLFSAQGQLLREYASGTTRISGADLPAGRYLLQVTAEGRTLGEWVEVR